MKKSVIELFAGVGGFRVGLNHIKTMDENGKAVENGNWKFVWADQWEPGTKKQDAYECYKKRFGVEEVSNQDISIVDVSKIPTHTLLCGGFPCQDYSVAHTLSNEKGIEGKKGVLFWDIIRVLEAIQTPLFLLENVDRLLKSPSKQKGRDFGIMLKTFDNIGYNMEWRIINAADYGNAQRRRRVFLFGWKKGLEYDKKMQKEDAQNVLTESGLFAKSFQVEKIVENYKCIDLGNYADAVDVTERFSYNFENTGCMIHGKVYTAKTQPIYITSKTVRDIQENGDCTKYILNEKQIAKFAYLRGNKKILRTRNDGTQYYYSEGAMAPYDSLDLPGRTMLTSEGSINRSTHIIPDKETGKLRLLTPIECERLQGFPDNWTKTDMTEKKRYFMMGNALVTNIISTLETTLSQIIENEL